MKCLPILICFFCLLCGSGPVLASSGEGQWQTEVQSGAQPVTGSETDDYQAATTATVSEVGKSNQLYVGGALGFSEIKIDFLFEDRTATALEGNLHVGYMFYLDSSETPYFLSPRLQAVFLHQTSSSDSLSAGDVLLAFGKYFSPEVSADFKAGYRVWERGNAESVLGVGAGYDLSDHLRATADYYRTVNFFSDASSYLLGLQYFF